MLDARSAHVGQEADRVVGEDLVVPLADGRLHERLVGVGRRGLELGAAHHDAVAGLADHVQQHVGVLVLRPTGPVALRVGVGRDVERVEQLGAPDVVGDVRGERRVDLVQHVLPVEQRPHLADRLVAHPGDHAAGVVEDGVDRLPFGPPVVAGARRARGGGAALGGLVVGVGQQVRGAGLVAEIVDPRADAHHRRERRVRGDVRDLLAVDPHLPAVAERLDVVLAGSQHCSFLGFRWF